MLTGHSHLQQQQMVQLQLTLKAQQTLATNILDVLVLPSEARAATLQDEIAVMMHRERGEQIDDQHMAAFPQAVRNLGYHVKLTLTPESRLLVYPALPPGSKYELVLDKAEHSVFTEGRLPGDKEKRNPNHHRAILAVTTAFWDAYLRDDSEARRWLDQGTIRPVP